MKIKNIGMALLLIASVAGQALAATVTWDGGGGDDSWNTALNWDTDTVPTASDLVVNTMPNETVIVGAGVVAVANELRIAEEDGPSQIDINAGGTLTTGTPTLYLGYGGGSAGAKAGTMNINGGAVTAGLHMYVGSWGSGLLNMTAGTLNVGGYLVINNTNFGATTGHLQLDGGTIDAATLSMKDASGSMDITGGTFVFTSLAGGLGATVGDLISGGHITGYGGTGTVNVDTLTDPGRTILTAAIPEPATLAIFAVFGGALLGARRRFQI